jgi:hypothetical protein
MEFKNKKTAYGLLLTAYLLLLSPDFCLLDSFFVYPAGGAQRPISRALPEEIQGCCLSRSSSLVL